MSEDAHGLWEWTQWELVGMQHLGDEVILDVIQVERRPWQHEDALMSVALVASDPGVDLTSVAATLATWVSSDAVCDVIHADRPGGSLALFQDSQLLVFATA